SRSSSTATPVTFAALFKTPETPVVGRRSALRALQDPCDDATWHGSVLPTSGPRGVHGPRMTAGVPAAALWRQGRSTTPPPPRRTRQDTEAPWTPAYQTVAGRSRPVPRGFTARRSSSTAKGSHCCFPPC